MENKSRFSRLRRYLMAGAVVVVPVYLTLWVLWIIFSFVDSILGKFVNVFLQRTLGFYIPGLGLVFFFFFLIITGFLATRLVGRRVFPHIERWFASLPLISKVYPAFRQIIRFILEQKEFGFKKVVMVEYPGKGIWSLGFLTNEQFGKLRFLADKEMVSIFVPTSPGPLSGNIIFVPKDDVRFLDISIGDALKIVMSGGVFKPE